MKTSIKVPPIQDPMMLSILLGKVHAMNSENLFVKGGKFWMRCPSGQWTNENVEQIEVEEAFYLNRSLPFSMVVEPGGVYVFEKATRTVIAQQQEEGKFLTWDYTENEITIVGTQ